MGKIVTDKLDVLRIREDFPILKREVKPGKQLVYLDSAATSQKPNAVIDVMNEYYHKYNANIHRGVHTLAEEATALYENARKKITSFIGAKHSNEVIFTRNTTESINLVSNSWGRANLSNGDTILLTEMEHHSNLVPWHILAQERNIRLEFIPVNFQGLLDIDEYHRLLDLKPCLVAFTHMSNVLGTINPAKQIIADAHQAGAVTLLDGAQSVPHFSINVQDLDVDFLAFSAHKMCGPTGIGILYGKQQLLNEMPPFLGGGDMIKKVYLRSFTSNDLPHKFEAGTPSVAEAVGFGTAVDYLSEIGMEQISAHDHSIVAYGIDGLSSIPGLHLIGPEADLKGGVIAFTMDGVHPHDVAQILDNDGIAVRAGHHCAMPLHDKYKLPATTRASFYFYTTREEIDLLVKSLYKVKKMFGA